MYTKILVPVDGSDTSNAGLLEALRLAKNQGAELRLLHIVDEYLIDGSLGYAEFTGDVIESLRSAGAKVMAHARELALHHGVGAETVVVESVGTSPAISIIEQAKKWPADLIVMGTHGRRGLRRLAMGSDAEGVVRGTKIPVLLIHRPESDETVAAKPRRMAAKSQPSAHA